MKLSFMILSHIRYQSRHRIFRILLACCSFHRVGGPQFSGMILGVNFGSSTPELFCSFSLEKSYSPSRLKCPHDWGEWIAIIRRSLSGSSAVLASLSWRVMYRYFQQMMQFLMNRLQL